MTELPYFLEVALKDPIIKSILTNGNFSKVDFKPIEHKEILKNWYQFINFKIDKWIFKSVEIIISPNGISINLLSNDEAYFDNSILYFDTDGIQYEKEPYLDLDNGLELREFRKKIGRFHLLNRDVNVAVLKSSAYGCIIKLGFY